MLWVSCSWTEMRVYDTRCLATITSSLFWAAGQVARQTPEPLGRVTRAMMAYRAAREQVLRSNPGSILAPPMLPFFPLQ